MNFPIVIYENKECLFPSATALTKLSLTKQSILWVRQGLYGMIPKEVIQNELQIRVDRVRIAAANNEDHFDVPLGFKWSETQDVPNGAKIIKLLEES